MATYHSPKIVTDGLILFGDTKNNKCYVSGSSNYKNMVTNVNSSIPAGTYFTSSTNDLYFSGTNSAIVTDIKLDTYFNSGSAFTIGAFINMPAYQYTGYIGQSDFMAYGFHLGIQTNHKLGANSPSGEYLLAGPVPNYGSNEFIMATMSNRTGSFYYNGKLYSTSIAGFDYGINANKNFNIGGNYTWAACTGYVYTSFIYNRALSAAEVLQNYNTLKTRFGL